MYCRIYNLGQKFCRTFQVLAQFPFTTTEAELHYYYQNVVIQVTSRVAERLKIKDLRKLGNIEKIHEMLVIGGKFPLATEKVILTVVQEDYEKSTVKRSIETPIVLNFVTFSTIFFL